MMGTIQLALEFVTNNPELSAVVAMLVVGLTEITKDLVKPFSDILVKQDQLCKVIALIWGILLFTVALPMPVYAGLIFGLITTYGYKFTKKANKK